jgi:acyl-CoA thioester hydrolase
VVYYANYLKFLERARSEAIYSLGLSNKKLLEEHRALIIVKSCNINYLKPAKFEDNLKIISIIKVMTKTSFIMKQIVKRDNDTISEAEVHLVIVNEQGRPIKIPEILKNKFKDYLSS